MSAINGAIVHVIESFIQVASYSVPMMAERHFEVSFLEESPEKHHTTGASAATDCARIQHLVRGAPLPI